MIEAIFIGLIPIVCSAVVISLDLWLHPITTMSRFEQEMQVKKGHFND